MKISIGAKIIEGPYGGGNTFIVNLKNYLENQGHQVINELNDNDIDLILLINPLRFSEVSTFNHFEINKYLENVNNNAVVIQRVNECDERKNTKNVNKQIIYANKFVDYTVFVSNWLQDLYLKSGINLDNSKVIKSGSDTRIFNQVNKRAWDKKEKFSFVTHHWSSHWMKGFESYYFVDKLLDQKKFSDLFEFTYIGNLPENCNFKNIKVLKPMSGIELSDELKKHHGYITGTINEPSGNHHIEAALCGLPILFLKSGGTPEYTTGFGVAYESTETLVEKIYELIDNYEHLFENLKDYPYTADSMLNEYYMLFQKIIMDKKNILEKRKKINKFVYATKLFNLKLFELYFQLKIFTIKILRG